MVNLVPDTRYDTESYQIAIFFSTWLVGYLGVMFVFIISLLFFRVVKTMPVQGTSILGFHL